MGTLDKVGSEPAPAEAAFVDLLDVSKKMLELARAGEWLEVVTLEEQREGLLKAIFTPAPPSDLKPEFIRNKIEQVMDYDRQLALLAKVAQQEIVSALEHLTKSRQGISEYHQNQDLA